MNTLSRVKAILEERLTISHNDIVGKSNLTTDLGADSLDRVEIAMDIEDEFGIMVSDEDAESFSTVDCIVQFIERNL